MTPDARSPSTAPRAAPIEDDIEPDAEPQIEIRLDEGAGRFIASSGSSTAFLQYRLRAGRFVIVHTEVPPTLGGRGLGGRLVRAAVAHARDRGDTIVPWCPFARSWLLSHPDVARTVAIDWPPVADDDGADDVSDR